MVDVKPKTLGEYVDCVNELDASSSSPLWYRGASKLSYQLLPTLYRKRLVRQPDVSLSDLEQSLVDRFEERSIPYQSRPLEEGTLESLFLMQHFGVPTRLLDWTENPFIGLFFALRNVPYKFGKHGDILFRNRAAVWVLDAAAWNRAALAHQSYQGGPLNPSHEVIAAYRPIGEIDTLAPSPVALYGAHNSPRIVAQQGTFVLFGRDTKPMEKIAQEEEFPDECLTRIVLTRGVVRDLRSALFRHGITEASLFPDLEGLGRDLQRTFGFAI